MDKIDVSAIDLSEYAQSLGWKLIKEALNDGLFLLNSPYKEEGDYSQLSFPKDISNPQHQDSAYISLKKLAEMYKKSVAEIVDEVREVNDDVICLRYYSEIKTVNSLSFEEAFDTIKSTRQMLLSAASTVVCPQVYHPKLNRMEPQDLIKRTRYRHTQEGSFILKISIPFEPTTYRSPLSNSVTDNIETGLPIGRQTAEIISLAGQKILESIESNTITDLWNEQSHSKQPILSYNFCESLLGMFDEERELPFELRFNWSRMSLRTYPAPKVPSTLKFPFSYKYKIEELREKFAPAREKMNGLFFGTVEQLNGDPGPDKRRSGEVIIKLFIDPDPVKAKANLNADDYAIAIKAHETGGALLMFKAKLNRKNRIANIEEISDLKLTTTHF